MFSTSTTASSTKPPIAMANPPSVMVLMDMPKYLNTNAVTQIETGMAVSAINVVRSVPRNTKRITATKPEAAISLPFRLLMELSIKVA